MKPKIIIPPVFLFTSLLIIVIIYFLMKNFNIIRFPYNLLGIALIIFGILIVGKSKQLFIKHNTPHSYEKSTTIVEESIYKYSRNPMYFGMIVFVLGFSVCFGNIIGIIIPFIFLYIINFVFIPFEEKKMEATFGKQYLEYKSRVRRWI